MLTIGFGTIPAQAQQVVQQFTVEDGLPSNEVHFVHQDSRGFIWFCTDRGVSQFDGNKFKNYTTQNGLTFNTAFKIFEDLEGNLWFTCYDGSISIWDNRTLAFRPYRFSEVFIEEWKKLRGAWVRGIAFYKDSIEFYLNHRTSVTHLFRNDSLLVNKNRTYSKFPIVSERNTLILSPSQKNYFTICKSKSKIREEDKDRIIEWEKMVLERVKFVTEVFSAQSSTYFSTDKGLYKFDIHGEKQQIFPETVITSLFLDHENNLWVCTTNKGVYLLHVEDVTSIELNNALERSEAVTAVYGKEDKLLVATDKSRLLDVTNGRFIHQSTSTDLPMLDFYANKSGLFIGSHQLKAKNNLFYESQDFGVNAYYVLYKSKDSLLYSDPSSLRLRVKGKEEILFYSRILHATPYGDKKCLYSTFDGVYELDFLTLRRSKNKAKSFDLSSHSTVRKIRKNGNYLLFCTSGEGVLVWDEQTQMPVLKITTQNGLPSSTIHDAFLDIDRKVMWVATNKGLTKLTYTNAVQSLKIQKVVVINKRYGIHSNTIKCISEGLNTLYFASNQTVTSMPKDFSLLPLTPPKTSILSVRSIQSGKSPVELEFKPNDSDLAISFGAYTMHKPLEGGMFKYRLSLPDRAGEWIPTDETNLNLLNLTDGQYLFELCARSLNSTWSKPVNIRFTIKAPWYKWLWLQILMGLVAISLVVLFVRYRLKRIEELNEHNLYVKDLEMINNNLELATLRGQMNPHFIFNAIKSVQGKVLKGDKWEANRLLTKFAKLMRLSLEHSRKRQIRIKDEVVFLKKYLVLEQERAPTRFQFQIHLNMDEETSSFEIPSLMIQPICENAVKHAFTGELGSLEIEFSYLQSDAIQVKVSDNGVGYLNQEFTESIVEKSYGLELVKQRIKYMTEIGQEADIQFEYFDKQKQLGTIVTMVLPIYE